MLSRYFFTNPEGGQTRSLEETILKSISVTLLPMSIARVPLTSLHFVALKRTRKAVGQVVKSKMERLPNLTELRFQALRSPPSGTIKENQSLRQRCARVGVDFNMSDRWLDSGRATSLVFSRSTLPSAHGPCLWSGWMALGVWMSRVWSSTGCWSGGVHGFYACELDQSSMYIACFSSFCDLYVFRHRAMQFNAMPMTSRLLAYLCLIWIESFTPEPATHTLP